ncbi:hypothetical protein BG000_003085 [Podila horticola]|nr:hypothetical protein BG000_003085 [Podila horticola]
MKITAIVSLGATILACADASSVTNTNLKGHTALSTRNPNFKHNAEAQIAELSKRHTDANILAGGCFSDEECNCSNTCDLLNNVCVPGINDYCIIHPGGSGSGSGGSGSGSRGSGSGSGSGSPSTSMGHKLKPFWFL